MMKRSVMSRRYFLSAAAVTAVAGSLRSIPAFCYNNDPGSPPWDAAKFDKVALKLSVWVLAQDVQRLLSEPAGLDKFVDWSKKQGVTKVYLEAYGRGLYVDRAILENVKKRFLREGFEIQGGIQTVNGPDNFEQDHCFTGKNEQEELQRIFEYTASVFDEIIIDDWFFTNCSNEESIKARGDRSWPEYNSDVMVKMSRERVMLPSHKVNPNVKVIVKYPQWSEGFQTRGYDVVRQSKIFDGIWAGTEAREFDYNSSAGYETSYNAYFNMRWLANFGKVDGGWFDTGGDRTKVNTYLEQARHTVLGGAKEMILCFYTDTFPADKFEGLRRELPGLMKLASIIKGKPIKGVQLVKPGNSDPFEEEYVCSFLGSLGLPLFPASEIDERAAAAFFPVQALKDQSLIAKLERMLAKGTPIVITDGLAKRLATHPDLVKKTTILPVQGSPKSLLKMTREEIRPFRDKLLRPFGITFDAPSKVEFYLFGDDTLAIGNMNNEAVDVILDLPKVTRVKKVLTLPEAGGNAELSLHGKTVEIKISARTLAVIEYR